MKKTINKIRARLTIYNHDEMSDKELKFFKKWVKEVLPEIATNKRGDLSKVFRATLFKS